MLPVYTMEAVRNFQAMDSDCNIRKGEELTLILGNQKLCLVHRKDDLPFVVPNSYVSLKTPMEEKRPGSFSKFLLRDRKSMRNRQTLPMSASINLESVKPQYAVVTDPFSATSHNEVDLYRDTAVLILNADPQSLYFFGVTQCGAYGLLPRNNVSIITQRGTPSLQQGCRLTAYTRKAYKSDQQELAVMKGWNLEIIGMPEPWRWQVRMSKGERKVGLLPVHVLGEVSVIDCPLDDPPAELMSPRQDIPMTAIPVGLDAADIDPINLELMKKTSEESIKRRQSRPLPGRPDQGSLNDLNRPTGGTPRYVNYPENHFSMCSQESSLPHELVSNEEAMPRKLEGASGCDYYDHEYNSLPSPRERGGTDVLDDLERLVRTLRHDRESLKRSSEEKQREAHHWRQTADNIYRLVNEAQKSSHAMISLSQQDLHDPFYYHYPYDFRYFRGRNGPHDRFGEAWDKVADQTTVSLHRSTEDMRLDFVERGRNTIPRDRPVVRKRRLSLVQFQNPNFQKETIKEEELHLSRSCSQPLLDVGDDCPVVQSPLDAGNDHKVDQQPLDIGYDCKTDQRLLDAGSECTVDQSSKDRKVDQRLPGVGDEYDDNNNMYEDTELVFMPPEVNRQVIDAVVSVICPPQERRPKLHWKPILLKLGLREDTARRIAKSDLTCREQWREAMLAWRDEVKGKASTSLFLGKVAASGNQDLYREITTKCTCSGMVAFV